VGSLRKRGDVWWIRYYRAGRRYEESAHTEKKQKALDLLKIREGDVAKGLPITAKIGQFRFEDAAADIRNDYSTNRKKSLKVLERRINKHLAPWFGGRRMAAINTVDVRAYIAKRQSDVVVVRKAHHERNAEGDWVEVEEITRAVSNAEINRELTTLKRMFNLAVQAGKLLHRPYIPLLQENNVRKGFFEVDQIAAVVRRLPESLQPVIKFAYVTGWRIPSEVLTLEWRQVDLRAGEVWLDPGTRKNGEGRVFPFTPELRQLLEAQKAAVDELKTRGLIVPWVFFRMVADKRGGTKHPKPIRAFNKAWAKACHAAGCPGRIPHDLRRTAVRNLVRAGVPERVAMKLTGHKTRSVFERYNIVSDGDLRDAVTRLSAFTGTVWGQSTPIAVNADGPIVEFAEENLEAPPGFEPGMEVLQISLGCTR
jgi:integrase